MDNASIWEIIDSYFRDTPQAFVKHHVDSYNYFYKNDIYSIFRGVNPIKIVSKEDTVKNEFGSQCNLYFGGKNGDKVYFGKPVISENGKERFMFPNEARLRNMTYAMTIHYDIEIEIINILKENEEPSLEGNEFRKQMLGGNIEIIEDEEAPILKGGTKTNKVIINTTPNIAANLEREARLSTTTDEKGVRRQILTDIHEKVYLGKFPIMVQSEFCILNGLTRENRFSLGECKNDIGGYFIIDGKEKAIVSQEKFADNMLYIRKFGEIVDDNDAGEDADEIEIEKIDKPIPFLYSAQIVSLADNFSKAPRTFSIKMVGPTKLYSNMNLVVNIPNVKLPIPLFIVFRALGVLSDKSIISMCLLDIEKYEYMMDLFIPSIHDGGSLLTQEACLNYIGLLTKGRKIHSAHEILIDYLLPHIGGQNYLNKAYYLGYMVFRILCVHTGIENPTDRDSLKYKRVELIGPLLYTLFNDYFRIQSRNIRLGFDRILTYNKNQYESNLLSLISTNYNDVFKNNRDLEVGVKKAFKGNWGAHPHSKLIGVVQDLDRLSFNATLSHLRKFILPMDPSLKIVEPRKLHGSQWGYIDPIDTPDGSKIGFHKNLAVSTQITRGYSKENIIQWLHENIVLNMIDECNPISLSVMTKLFVNGAWIGSLDEPLLCVEKMLLYRRNGLIPIYTSITFDIKENAVYIYTDSGRLCRPIFYTKGNEVLKDKEFLKKKNDFLWKELTTGFNEKKVKFEPNECKIYKLNELYNENNSENNPALFEKFQSNKAVIDFIDSSETENSLIAFNSKELKKAHTHCEIHESFIFGVMGNQINFPNTNHTPRNLFSCGQSKQACSLYHTNYQVRMDKSALVLNYGQIPILKSRYNEYINHNENPYGENTVVAIMCYTGYNVEDALLINEGSLKRGLFQTSYFTTYETHEEKSVNDANIKTDKTISNINKIKVIKGKKMEHNYDKLDMNGIIKEGETVDENTVLIGLTSNNIVDENSRIDMSITPKKGQLGVVDKVYITEGDEGQRIAKVRIVHQRIPTLGDKFASRVGQKGTIGMVIREADMPYTKDGLRPDIIINPHAIPSRMTIGQLIESITGKACCLYGGFGDCTSFNQVGSKIDLFGKLLTKEGYHSKGNEIMYNGMTGEQIESDIFVGLTYYMRLKHMVKDKINYRGSGGPRTQLTRQAVGGRANDGGLRIGEMEKDSLVSYGATNFVTESMMKRGDKYYIAVCNKSGMTAIYNPSRNLFMSPIVDGPVTFSGLSAIENIKIENVSRFGRDFSVVSVPYTFKLMIQELGCMNLQLRIITEDNINQIENLASHFDIKSLNQNIEKNIKGDKAINIIEEIDDDPFVILPDILPDSPPYVLPDTPPYVLPDSPHDYEPVYNSISPPFIPSSPTDSPFYVLPDTPPGYEPVQNSVSPPFIPTMKGGNDKGDFMINEIVYLKNDKSQKWYILNIDYKTQIVVLKPESDNGEPIIVQVSDIEREGNIETLLPSTAPSIVFAPIIKVVNGNDNSSSDGSDTIKEEKTGKKKISGGGGGGGGEDINSFVKSNSGGRGDIDTDTPDKKNNNGGVLGSIIDFTKNVIIKKIM
jgi:DNA-directed RNA polymerase II subunit RPB2